MMVYQDGVCKRVSRCRAREHHDLYEGSDARARHARQFTFFAGRIITLLRVAHVSRDEDMATATVAPRRRSTQSCEKSLHTPRTEFLCMGGARYQDSLAHRNLLESSWSRWLCNIFFITSVSRSEIQIVSA